jgi:hypothetical protein
VDSHSNFIMETLCYVFLWSSEIHHHLLYNLVRFIIIHVCLFLVLHYFMEKWN